MIKKILDKLYFKYIIKEEFIRKEDKAWLKDHAEHLIRIFESSKKFIANRTFTSLLPREHQRRKDWFDCLEALQALCKEARPKNKINPITGKPPEKAIK
jgi:hypothetical protein